MPHKSFQAVIAALILALGIAIGLGIDSNAYLTNAQGDTPVFTRLQAGDRTSDQVDFDIFWDVWESVQERHVDQPLNEVDMLQGAIAGLVAGVGDPYSVYFTPEQTQEFFNEINGSFEGIGAEVGIKNEQITIIAPLPNSPAEQAGALPGDIILAVDGLDTAFMSLNAAVDLIRGEGGTEVILTIQRASEDRPIELAITRDTIQVESVTSELVEQGEQRIAYIELSRFNADTPQAFQSAVQELLLEQPDGLVLDMRNNAGGFLEAAVDVSSAFVPEGSVVVYEEESAGDRIPFLSTGAPSITDIPVVVLINGGSASAAEIVAGALKDSTDATIIGETSFGKGTVQDVEYFGDGSSLKLTIARWLTPNGDQINEVGIEPDTAVERTPEDFSNDRDPQRDAAIESIIQSVQ